MKFNIEPFVEKIPKPWGQEILYTPDSLNRVGKILLINKGGELSFQYHEQKEETLCLFQGSAMLWLEDLAGEIQKFPMLICQGYTILAKQKHKIVALADSVVLEVSTPETGTTVRLEDKYQRSDETDQTRAEKNRGWNDPAK